MGAVSTIDFMEFFKTDEIAAPYIRGVFARDTLPQNKNIVSGIYIVNTDKIENKGQHWIVICVDFSKNGEYFDSLGMPPLYEEFADFLSGCHLWQYNERMIQGINSQFCGHFCAAYIQCRVRGDSMQEFTNRFTSDPLLNDNIIKNWVKIN